jgi:hypothetical protein
MSFRVLSNAQLMVVYSAVFVFAFSAAASNDSIANHAHCFLYVSRGCELM